MSAIEHDLTPNEMQMLQQRLRGKETRWHWVRHEGRRIMQPVLRMDGGVIAEASSADSTPPAVVVRAVLQALQHRHERRSAAATRAAVTRAKRQERLVYEAAQRLREQMLTRRSHCRICGRALDDADSVARGIGSECWQSVLAALGRSHNEVA
jgi:hypothetical protein